MMNTSFIDFNIYTFDPKQNEFVCIVGHGSESFAAF